jgi:hypothetical protein
MYYNSEIYCMDIYYRAKESNPKTVTKHIRYILLIGQI